jgi:hypothetical protein
MTSSTSQLGPSEPRRRSPTIRSGSSGSWMRYGSDANYAVLDVEVMEWSQA